MVDGVEEEVEPTLTIEFMVYASNMRDAENQIETVLQQITGFDDVTRVRYRFTMKRFTWTKTNTLWECDVTAWVE